MSIATSFFLKKEKDKKFKEFEAKWGSDQEILKEAKMSWLATRGNHLMQQNQVKEAIEDFKEILEINPERVTAYTYLAGAYATKKDYLSAMKSLLDCKRMITRSKDEKVKIQIMDIYFLTGAIELEMGDATKATECFYGFLAEEKAVSQNPVWQELIRDSELIRNSGVMENTNVKNTSLKDEHEERVRFAKEMLTKLKDANTFSITVNYDLPMGEAVETGKYDWKNDNITSENFPSTRTGMADIEFTFIHFDRLMKFEEVIKEFDRQGLRAAELLELLAFGAKYPNEQLHRFPIVALGSRWLSPDGHRYAAPCLAKGYDKRGLDLLWFVGSWGSGCQFAAVRK